MQGGSERGSAPQAWIRLDAMRERSLPNSQDLVYWGLGSDPLKAAADRIAGRIAGAMRGEPAKVVALETQRK